MSKKPIDPNLVEHAEFCKIVKTSAKQFIRHLYDRVQEEGKDPLPISRIKIMFSRNSSRCTGGSENGVPRITMSFMGWQFLEKNRKKITEYKSYARDPIIGDIDPKNFENAVKVLVAHEVAHAVQSACFKMQNEYNKPHGEGFKYLYGILRKEVINPLIENTPEDKRDQRYLGRPEDYPACDLHDDDDEEETPKNVVKMKKPA